ncbi:MAG: hypothetical protein ACKV2Q_25325 [Planctomycetaceae bacterium]
MLFESRVLHTSKDFEFAGDYEDAFELDGERGLVAIADGVASAIFSRLWADILTRAVVAEPPDLYQEAAFKLWLSERRRDWLSQIDVAKLPWNQRQKLQQVGGAFSTLMWLQVWRETHDRGAAQSGGEVFEPRPLGSGQDTSQQPLPDGRGSNTSQVQIGSAFRCRCFGIGDCNLFHVRDGVILRAFPLTTTAEFERDPISICSVNLNRDHGLEFSVLDEVAQAGDLLVLCTDAIGKWAVTRMQAGDPPQWEAYWEMPHDEWLAEIAALRRGNQMRFDDTTLVLLRLKAEASCESADGCGETTEPIVMTEVEAQDSDPKFVVEVESRFRQGDLGQEDRTLAQGENGDLSRHH